MPRSKVFTIETQTNDVSFCNTCYNVAMTGWLFVYKVPSEPSTARVTIWRRMKSLGAIYLQQSVCFLTDSESHRVALHTALQDVRDFGGEAHLFQVQQENSVGNTALTIAFSQARNAEYAELHEQIDLLTSELEREIRAEKFTFAELEDTESGLERLRTWLDRIHERDLPDSQPYRAAAAAVADITERVRAFAATVYQRETNLLPDVPEETKK